MNRLGDITYMQDNKNKKESSEETEDIDVEGLVDAINSSSSLPLPSVKEYYDDEEDRIIWIDKEISDDEVSIIKKIIGYNKADKDVAIEERKPIKILLNTPGGSVPVMWCIANAIRMSKTPVITINMCECLSAGSTIFAAGHKKLAMPGSTFLIHSGSCAYGGTVEQVNSAKKYYDALSKKADDFLLSKLNIDAKTFKKKSQVDWYISDEEAVNIGLADKIVEDIYEVA